jgi:hypothetical protein
LQFFRNRINKTIRDPSVDFYILTRALAMTRLAAGAYDDGDDLLNLVSRIAQEELTDPLRRTYRDILIRGHATREEISKANKETIHPDIDESTLYSIVRVDYHAGVTRAQCIAKTVRISTDKIESTVKGNVTPTYYEILRKRSSLQKLPYKVNLSICFF